MIKIGAFKHPLYKKWANMIQRCTNKNNTSYRYYGGRGITICERWRKSFWDFVADMGLPSHGMSIERRNNNEGYSPENCYWANSKVQANNRNNTQLLTAFGATGTLSQWGQIYRIRPNTIYMRIRKCNWSIEKALTAPVKTRQKRSKPGK